MISCSTAFADLKIYNLLILIDFLLRFKLFL